MKIFGYDLFFDMILCGLCFKIQQITVFLVRGFIIFCVTNQAPQVSFNFVVEDSMLVFSYEITAIRCCELLDISEAISDYGAQAFALHIPRLPYLLSHAHLLTKLVKRKAFCIRLDTCS